MRGTAFECARFDGLEPEGDDIVVRPVADRYGHACGASGVELEPGSSLWLANRLCRNRFAKFIAYRAVRFGVMAIRCLRPRCDRRMVTNGVPLRARHPGESAAGESAW